MPGVGEPTLALEDAPDNVAAAAKGAALGKQLGAALVQIQQGREAGGQEDQALMLEKATEAVSAFPALLAFSNDYRFFLPLLTALLMGTLRPPCTVSKVMADLTEEDGDQIGGDFAFVVTSGKLGSDQSVEKWIKKHAALQQLDKEPWFRPAVNALGKELLKSSTFGAKVRL